MAYHFLTIYVYNFVDFSIPSKTQCSLGMITSLKCIGKSYQTFDGLQVQLHEQNYSEKLS